ncbi:MULTISPECIES: FAD-binding oxidoreductase [Pseudomonas]|mgnify:CR=1 FL=1|jgi:putative aminophosphonate oxidoreductase|uniref:Aminophosphonate oxidoreductase n=1 Tax=Pseudomonas citronellolis TaxID=53408 RepID=A0A127MS75_9PSED|nr:MULTISPECIES: FAD-binding oxidoreductase [Pseudomonas]KSW27564.1 aminophosphonate oxidoreductase [Pseudomonas sp. ADP]AMO76126.1 Gamma-glutamylputrescine oxidoreductase [Pseudomonas citronellolis]ANI15668.1 aminophosphonate oxidoreductase [Pseudomonas citronellolis]KES25848.1 aminophosphonate oxidoreductase [Pseudomonas sp. AAC]KRV79456.1 aminophosphonate oxidoreductase [Pseudomonas citronellolis]
MYRGFWYAQALDRDCHLAPSLKGNEQADVCIVGGGFLGLWSAIRLKQAHPERRIVIVERDRCGSGASGRNGGIATNWWAKYLSVMSICGEKEARRICEAAESAIDEIGSFCREHGIDAQYRKDGWLWTASNQRQVDSWKVLTDSLERHGVNPFRNLTREEVRRRTGSARMMGGIFDPNAATVQPAMLARGLRRVALELGVVIYEKSPLTTLERSEQPVVHTAQGSVRAKKVVVAMNAWGAQFPELRRMIAVMSSDMVATAPVKERLDQIGFSGGECITDSRTVLNYYRNTPDGRIVFGKPLGQFAFAGRIGDLYERPTPAAQKVAAEMRSFYPQLSDVPIVSSWTGPIDRAMKGLPNFGQLGGHPNIVFGIGFSGNGVGTTVFASRIIKSLVEEANDEWANCGLVNQKMKLFPPEPFRFIGAHLVRDALVRKESLEDRNLDASFLTSQLAALAPAGYVPAQKK